MKRKERIGRFLSSLDNGTESTVLEAKVVVLGSENGTCKNIGSKTCDTKNSLDCYNVGVYCGKKNSQKCETRPFLNGSNCGDEKGDRGN